MNTIDIILIILTIYILAALMTSIWLQKLVKRYKRLLNQGDSEAKKIKKNWDYLTGRFSESGLIIIISFFWLLVIPYVIFNRYHN